MLKPYISIILLLLTVAVTDVQAQKIPMYIGSYTDPEGNPGINSYLFDTKTADVTAVSKTKTLQSSFLARKHKLMLAVNELTDGNQSISAFHIFPDRLEFINKLPTSGSAPCHVIIDPKGRFAVVSNYLGGALDLYSIDEQKGLLNHDDQRKFVGTSVNSNRQEASHVHSAFMGPDGLVYVSDLGTDQIHIFEVLSTAGKYQFKEKGIIETSKGGGPRHLTFHPNKKYMYSIMELTADIAVYQEEGRNWKQIQLISMNADGFQGKNGAADIKISKDGKYLYSTDRVDANTIATFSIRKDGQLKKLDVQSVQGKGPRNFNFSPDQRFVLVGNQLSNEVVIFERNKQTGLLKDTGKRINAFMPVCILF